MLGGPGDPSSQHTRCASDGTNVRRRLGQWVEHILGVVPGDKKTIRKCQQPSQAATQEAEQQRDLKNCADRAKVDNIKRTLVRPMMPRPAPALQPVAPPFFSQVLGPARWTQPGDK